jgi:hypothetical protein
MTNTTLSFATPLQDIVIQLRDLRRGDEFLISAADAGSVERIAVHLTNIGVSVLASTQDHVNASKRLNDFAATLARIARKTVPTNEALNARMALTGVHLRDISGQLAEGNKIPEWAELAPRAGSSALAPGESDRPGDTGAA